MCSGMCRGGCEHSDPPPFTSVCDQYEPIAEECCKLLNPSNTVLKRVKRTKGKFVAGRALN